MPKGRHASEDGRSESDAQSDNHRPVKTTVQLPLSLRRWFKVHAASKDMTLYEVISNILVAYAKEHGYVNEDK